jgi:hypothetical protein
VSGRTYRFGCQGIRVRARQVHGDPGGRSSSTRLGRGVRGESRTGPRPGFDHLRRGALPTRWVRLVLIPTAWSPGSS